MRFLSPWDRTENINLGLCSWERFLAQRDLSFWGPALISPLSVLGLPPCVSCVSEQEAFADCEPVKWLLFLSALYPAPGKMPTQLFFEFWGGEEELRVESEGKATDSATRRLQAALPPSHVSA